LHDKVKVFPVPKYKELGTKIVWGYVKEVPELLIYFPDFKETEIPDHSFLWGILGTLRQKACQDLLDQARLARSKEGEA
jgi:hypothetical protein